MTYRPRIPWVHLWAAVVLTLLALLLASCGSPAVPVPGSARSAAAGTQAQPQLTRHQVGPWREAPPRAASSKGALDGTSSSASSTSTLSCASGPVASSSKLLHEKHDKKPPGSVTTTTAKSRGSERRKAAKQPSTDAEASTYAASISSTAAQVSF